jgi:hypothetical protein
MGRVLSPSSDNKACLHSFVLNKLHNNRTAVNWPPSGTVLILLLSLFLARPRVMSAGMSLLQDDDDNNEQQQQQEEEEEEEE